MYFPGNKNIPGLIQKIVNQVPPCKYFIEPCAGSAAVSMFLARAPVAQPQYHINDLDPGITDMFDYPAGSIVTNNPVLDIIKSLVAIPADPDTFVFIDPPYHHSVRQYNLELYKYKMTHQDHLKLLTAVRDLKCNCMIIHPRCDLYSRKLESWRTIQIKVRYHDKTTTEILYMNYPRPEQLLTYVAAGTDCWDRQRIKRKGDRIVKKLQSLSAVERNYILSRLSNTF